jgi:hypothetical protein
MAKKVVFQAIAWNEYLRWQTQDKMNEQIEIAQCRGHYDD